MGLSRTTAPARRRRSRRRKAGRPLGKLSLPPVRVTLPSRRRSRRTVKRPSWKLVGLAGAAGVAATGVIVARRRSHSDLAPDELRERLHSRLAAVQTGAPSQPPTSRP
ncbi:MAG: hypothetical protein QOJ63_2173 [Solirubrobacteraceae bacterium]|nr:hypothetical protein [Solirubrobacteraceae bacterium]